MAKLVVFYSRADENYFGGSRRYISVGNTEKVATMIAELTEAELFKIEQQVPYAADYDTCIAQAKKDLQAKTRPTLVSMPDSLNDYDEIYLGYPNYWGDMPMAVYTFLENFDWNGKTIRPFCTHEGSGLSGTERKIQAACKGATVTSGLAIQGGSVDRSKATIEKWV
jgi:flavodoxin